MAESKINNMKKLSFLLMLIAFNAVSQIKFEPGYFITNNDSRMKCLIKNEIDNNSPDSFEYKLNENSEVTIGKIKDIKEFSISGGFDYRKFEVNIDQSSNDRNKLSYQKDPEWSKQTVFLKLIFQGEINLYQHVQGNHNRYFISSGNHETVEQLVYKEYVNQENRSRVLTNNTFKQQLYVALQSTQLNESDFEKLKYNKDSLLKLFLKHGNQKGITFSNLESNKSKNIYNLKVNAGFGSASINVEDQYQYINYQSTGFTYRIGFEFESIFGYGHNKWAFFTDPNFQAYSDEGFTEFTYNAHLSKGTPIVSDFKIIQIPIGARHYMFLNKSKLFIDAGFAVNLNLNSTITTDISTREMVNSSNFFAGIGFNYGRYSIEARYNLVHAMNIAVYYFELKYSSFNVIASYNFL